MSDEDIIGVVLLGLFLVSVVLFLINAIVNTLASLIMNPVVIVLLLSLIGGVIVWRIGDQSKITNPPSASQKKKLTRCVICDKEFCLHRRPKGNPVVSKVSWESPRDSYKAQLYAVRDSPSESCLICKKTIHSFEEVVQCPACAHQFHRGHFGEWVKIKGTCPVCQRGIYLTLDGQNRW